MPQQLRSHALASAEQGAARCYLSPRRCTERLLPRHDAQGNPGESSPLPGRPPARTQHKSHEEPWASDAARDGFPGAASPRVRLAARTSPSSCCDPRTTLEAQTGAEPPPAPACPERGHQHARSLSQGGCYNGIYTTERLQLLCEHKSWIQLSSAASPVRSGAAGVGGKAAGQVSSAAMPGGVSGPGGSRSPACPRVQGAGGCPGPAPP